MPGVGGAPGPDGRRGPCHPGRGRGGARGPTASGPRRQRPGGRGRGGAVVAGGGRAPVRWTSRRPARGRTVTRSRSTASSATRSWTARSSRANPKPARWARCGRRGTIPNARTVRWGTRHRPSSRRQARGTCRSKRVRMSHCRRNKRTDDSRDRWTKKWGAGQLVKETFEILPPAAARVARHCGRKKPGQKIKGKNRAVGTGFLTVGGRVRGDADRGYGWSFGFSTINPSAVAAVLSS